MLVKEAGPATPVELLGLNGAPNAGDKFNIMTDEREAKDIQLFLKEHIQPKLSIA